MEFTQVRRTSFGNVGGRRLSLSLPMFTFGGHGKREGKFDNCSAITVLSNGSYATTDTNNRRIQIFDSEGNFVKSVHHAEKLRLPWGIATRGNEDSFFVTDGELNALIKVTNDGKITETINLKGPLDSIKEAGPLSINPQTNFAAIADLRTPRVYLYQLTKGFKLKAIIRLDPPDGDSVAENVAIGPENKVFVCFGPSSHQIHCYSEKGETMCIFGNFLCPTGLWVTPSGNLIIADREQKSAELYTNSGEFIQVLVNPGFGLNTYPHSVCLTRDNHIALTTTPDFYSYADRVNIFKLSAQ